MVTKELKNRTNHISLLDADGKSKIELQKQKLKAGATSQDIYDCNIAQAGFSNLEILSNGYINKYAMTLILPQNVLSGVEYVTGCFQVSGYEFILSTRLSTGFGGKVYKTIDNGVNWTEFSTQDNQYVQNTVKDAYNYGTGDSYGQVITSTGGILFASSGDDFLTYGGSGYGTNYEFAKGGMFINVNGKACYVLKTKSGGSNADGFEAYWRGTTKINIGLPNKVSCCCGDNYTEFVYAKNASGSSIYWASNPNSPTLDKFAQISHNIIWAKKIDGRIFNVSDNGDGTYSLYRTAGIITNNPVGVNDLVFVMNIPYDSLTNSVVYDIVNAGANFYMLTKDTIWKSTDNTGATFEEFKTLPNCKIMWCYDTKLSITAGNEVYAFEII